MPTNPETTDYDKILGYGRFATIKFRVEKDALKFYLEKVKVSVSLVTGKKGMPFIFPGELLKKYIEEMDN